MQQVLAEATPRRDRRPHAAPGARFCGFEPPLEQPGACPAEDRDRQRIREHDWWSRI
jgi:hypothetical protein